MALRRPCIRMNENDLYIDWSDMNKNTYDFERKKNTQTRTKERDKNELSKHNKKSLLTCLSASKLFRFHLSNCMTFFSFLALPFTQIKSIDSRKWTRKQYRLTKKKPVNRNFWVNTLCITLHCFFKHYLMMSMLRKKFPGNFSCKNK